MYIHMYIIHSPRHTRCHTRSNANFQQSCEGHVTIKQHGSAVRVNVKLVESGTGVCLCPTVE